MISEVGLICEHGWCASTTAHEARLRREAIVNASARDSNERGIDFQPGQGWSWSGTRRARRKRAAVVRP